MVHLGLDNTYARDLDGLYTPALPRGFQSPELMHLDDALRAELGLPELDDRVTAGIWSGSALIDDATPLAMAYAGHQFGGFSPQLGDGRAVLLGEIVDPQGHRWDLHLKGSGPTPFSRGGDGFAAVGPVLREQLVSFAMHHLGVPTTRVLATVRTGEPVYRQTTLPGAVLARVASSHLRIGTFQFFAVRNSRDKLERLVRYALQRHDPELLDSENPALALLGAVARRQATLIAAWMDVGFVHGVMNTDNTSISGETLDYGPCAFLDDYDPGKVFSSIDETGRYAYGNQPYFGQWNLARFGEALLPLIDPVQAAAVENVQAVLKDYAEAFDHAHRTRQRHKLGLSGQQPDDVALIDDLLDWMHADHRDYTATWRALATGLRTGEPVATDPRFQGWHARWMKRLGEAPPADVADRMDRVNPVYIPRNHKVEHALYAAVEGDLAPFHRLMSVLARPFDVQEGADDLAAPPPADAPPMITFCGT